MEKITKMKKLDFNIADVNEIYSGPVGILWEMLMGEQIHVGGENDTTILAEKAGVKKDHIVLDVCSALGGPARHLAKTYGCRVIGLDATEHMMNEAVKRTQSETYSNLIEYKLGNAIDMPFKSETFDIVWGQDAWCYVTDKRKIIEESYRVLKRGGILAFTDWIQVGNMTETEWNELNSFMAFPYMETFDGYEYMIKQTGFEIKLKEDLSLKFAEYCHKYQNMLRQDLKEGIINKYGNDMFSIADNGLNLWVNAADLGKVGRVRLIVKKI